MPFLFACLHLMHLTAYSVLINIECVPVLYLLHFEHLHYLQVHLQSEKTKGQKIKTNRLVLMACHARMLLSYLTRVCARVCLDCRTFWNELKKICNIDAAERSFPHCKHWHFTIKHCKAYQSQAPHTCLNIKNEDTKALSRLHHTGIFMCLKGVCQSLRITNKIYWPAG